MNLAFQLIPRPVGYAKKIIENSDDPSWEEQQADYSQFFIKSEKHGQYCNLYEVIAWCFGHSFLRPLSKGDGLLTLPTLNP